MENKTKQEKMIEELCQQFDNYVENMDSRRLYDFLRILEENSVLPQLSEACGKIKYPDIVLTCEKCEQLYGNCDDSKKSIEEDTKVCMERFKKYCQSPAKD